MLILVKAEVMWEDRSICLARCGWCVTAARAAELFVFTYGAMKPGLPQNSAQKRGKQG